MGKTKQIKWSNEAIHQNLFLRLTVARAKGRKVNAVQTAVYERVTLAAIADAEAELFGA